VVVAPRYLTFSFNCSDEQDCNRTHLPKLTFPDKLSIKQVSLFGVEKILHYSVFSAVYRWSSQIVLDEHGGKHECGWYDTYIKNHGCWFFHDGERLESRSINDEDVGKMRKSTNAEALCMVTYERIVVDMSSFGQMATAPVIGLTPTLEKGDFIGNTLATTSGAAPQPPPALSISQYYTLPEDMWIRCFSFLGSHDTAIAGYVSRSFQSLSSTDKLWEKICHRRWRGKENEERLLSQHTTMRDRISWKESYIREENQRMTMTREELLHFRWECIEDGYTSTELITLNEDGTYWAGQSRLWWKFNGKHLCFDGRKLLVERNRSKRGWIIGRDERTEYHSVDPHHALAFGKPASTPSFGSSPVPATGGFVSITRVPGVGALLGDLQLPATVGRFTELNPVQTVVGPLGSTPALAFGGQFDRSSQDVSPSSRQPPSRKSLTQSDEIPRKISSSTTSSQTRNFDGSRLRNYSLEHCHLSSPKQNTDTGRITFVHDTRKYGFITPDSNSNRIFVYINNVSAAILCEGARVKYEVGPGKNGKDRAFNVRYI